MLPEDKASSFGISWSIAVTVTILSSFLTYPLDTVKRRLMMQSGRKASDIMYKNALDCCRKMMRTEGVTAFYKGAVPGAIRALGAALVLVLYDKLKAL